MTLTIIISQIISQQDQDIIEIILLILLGIIILNIPLFFYLFSLRNTINKISIENRKIQSGQVWLMLIPLFGFVWQFFIVNRMAASLKAEFTKRNIQIEDKPGFTIGIVYCILSCIPTAITLIPALICWIIYWVKINSYNIKLQQTKNV